MLILAKEVKESEWRSQIMNHYINCLVSEMQISKRLKLLLCVSVVFQCLGKESDVYTSEMSQFKRGL